MALMNSGYQISNLNFGRIGVLMGGPSTERGVSLKSGKAVYESLKQVGLEVVAIDIQTDDTEENIRLINSYDINCAFIALHGRFGEDGQIQQILEDLRIPYTGPDRIASRLAMDKVVSRKIFEINGLSVPRYKVLGKASFDKDWKFDIPFEFPWVIKPATHGSSIGLTIVDKKEDLMEAIDIAFSFDDKILVEEYINGRELTVGILDDLALPVVEIIPKKRFFDYEAKYKPGLSDYVVPAQLEDSVSQAVQGAGLLAYKLLGCSDCSRVDIILNKENIPFILEVNTIPGLTQTSLLPKAANVAGINFTQLCIRLIELAYEKAKNKFASKPNA